METPERRDDNLFADEEDTGQDFFAPRDTEDQEIDFEEEEKDKTPQLNEEMKEKLKELEEQVKKLETKKEEIDKQNEQRQQYEQQQQQQRQQQQQASEENQIEIPEKPRPPKKPVDFNASEAYSDPSSSSAKYLQEKEEYRDSVEDWQTQIMAIGLQQQENRINDLTKSIAGALKEQETNLRRKTVYDNAVSDLVNKHGLNHEQARDFIATMQKPESLTLDNLVEIYKKQNNMDNQGPSDDFKQRQRSQEFRTPMSMQESKSNDSRPVENQLLSGFLKEQKKKFTLFKDE